MNRGRRGRAGVVRVLRLFWVFARAGALNAFAYRANFWFQLGETLLSLAASLGAVAVIFQQTDSLGGWDSAELTVLVGVYFLGRGVLNSIVAPSLSWFLGQVRTGDLDSTLLKPVDAQLLVSVARIDVFKSVEVLVGAAVVAVAGGRLGEHLGPVVVGQFVLALCAGGAIIYSVWLMLATLVFWVVRMENVLMIFWSVYGAARWPVGIYPRWLRWIMTGVIPVAFAVTVPAETLSGRSSLLELGVAWGVAVLLLLLSRWFWQAGLRRYSGASA